MLVSTLYAQKLNHQGKKMVKQITCSYLNPKNRIEKSAITKYIFGYDDETRLTKLEVFHRGSTFYSGKGWIEDKAFKPRCSIVYSNSTLHRTDYDEYGKKKDDYIYKYILDSDRYILQKSLFEKCLDGEYREYRKTYSYGYPYKDDIRQLVSESVRYFYQSHSKWSEVVGDRHTRSYDIIDGNTYIHKGETIRDIMYGVKYECAYNDLNINIDGIISGWDIEQGTEWCNLHSECLPKNLTDRTCYEYVYYFQSEEPYNLYKFTYGGKYLYTIEYVY